MDTIAIAVCEQYESAYKKAIEELGRSDLRLAVHPSLCLHPDLASEVEAQLLAEAEQRETYLFYASSCPVARLASTAGIYAEQTGELDTSHVICDAFGIHLLHDRAYVVTDDWIRNWSAYVSAMGLTQDTARSYFHEHYRYVAVVTADPVVPFTEELSALSSFLDLPYSIVPAGAARAARTIRYALHERDLLAEKKKQDAQLAELFRQVSDYAAVSDIQLQLMHLTKRRDIIDKLKLVFEQVFGARTFSYFPPGSDRADDMIRNWPDQERICSISQEAGRLHCKLAWHGTAYGCIEAREFLTPEHLAKYTNLMREIVHSAALVMHTSVQYERLEHISRHDALTNLYNRAYLKQFEEEHRNSHEITVFSFDIDGLKLVNDTHGHAQGDLLLRSFAEILQKVFREDDVLLRLGGDEFAAIVFATDETLVARIRERIKKAVRNHNDTVGEACLKLSFSTGVAIGKSSSDTLNSLFQEADRLMYEEKKQKKAGAG